MYLIFVHFRTDHICDAMELRSKSIQEPKSVVYEIPFVDGSKDVKMKDPAYQSKFPFVDGSKDVKMEDNPAYQSTN